jgi:hypothetical protein
MLKIEIAKNGDRFRKKSIKTKNKQNFFGILS